MGSYKLSLILTPGRYLKGKTRAKDLRHRFTIAKRIKALLKKSYMDIEASLKNTGQLRFFEIAGY